VAERPEPVTVLCTECGSIVTVKDVQALILALHLQNDCDISNLLVHREA
jgi:hypothetical protein